ncbi:MAG: phage portal protein [Anaerolineae bacterium]|nr:phage portal protein [Anaerolineae bacterium]
MQNWLSNLFTAVRGLRPAPHIQAVAAHNASVWPNLSEALAQNHVYQQSPWVYIAVNRIAEAAALVPLHVYRVTGEQRTGVNRHPLEDLLDAPNPYLSRFELIEQTVGHLELAGNAYWFLAGDAAGVPREIWPLRPDRVSIVPDAAQYVRGYIYEIDGQRIPLLPTEVVHFKRWHPANDYYGLSALEASRLAVLGDRAMAEWNRSTFSRDQGVPAGIVHIKEFVSDADFERIRREWQQSYGGPQRRTAFLRGGAIEWQNIGLNHNELDFLKGRLAHRDEILNCFGIPVGLISENATEANATVAERLFIERTLWPKLVRLAQKITQELLPFWPGEYIAEFEDIRPTDAQARLADIRTAYPLLSINELRERYYHLPPVTWGALPVNTAEPHPSTASASGEEAKQERTDDQDQDNLRLKNSSVSDDDEESGADDAVAELRRWERYTLKRWGRPARRAFAVQAVPDELAFEVSANLLAAESPDEARAVFAAARAELCASESLPA